MRVPPQKKMAAQKINISVQFWTTSWLDREYRISRMEQDIVDQKTACKLRSAITGVYACQIGEFWSTKAKNRTVVLTHPKSTSLDAHISEAKGLCPLKISQYCYQRLLMHSPRMSLPPNNFLGMKFRKLVNNLMYFGLYRQDLWGEFYQTFLRDVSPQGNNNLGIQFWGPSPPKILEPKNLVFNYTFLWLYCKFFWIGTRYRRSENGYC